MDPGFNFRHQFSYCPLQDVSSARFAIIEPESFKNDFIFITLVQRPLKEGFFYEALSYTWGDESDKVVIACREDTRDPNATQPNMPAFAGLAISRNCYNAIRRLSLPDSRVVWIDAICINQEDLAERSAQVRMMGDIFTLASRVVAYIGEETPSIRLVFEELKEVDKELSFPINRPVPNPKIREGLDEILQRSWFSRIWVIQEMAFADDVLFMCGSSTASRAALIEAISGYNNIRITKSVVPYVLTVQYDTFSEEQNTGLALWHLLGKTRKNLSTVAKDRIFAVIPLTDNAKELEALIDYQRSVEELFIDIATFLLSHIGPWLFLANRHGHKLKMPSWAPEWSQNTSIPVEWKTFSSLMANTDDCEIINPLLGPTDDWINQICGISTIKSIDSQGVSTHIMCVQGVQYSSVIEMGARFHFADIGHAREVLVDLLSTIEQGKIHNHGSRITEFYRKLDNEHLTPELLRYFLKITIQDAMELFTRGLYSSEDADVRGFEARLWSDINPSEEDFQNFEEGMQDCKVVVTRNGALAIAPESTREGDIICVFREAISPCILRRRPGNTWAMISGDCFVLGELGEFKRKSECFTRFIEQNRAKEEQFRIC